jgi:hypothetical protein
MTNVYKNIYHTSSFLRLPALPAGRQAVGREKGIQIFSPIPHQEQASIPVCTPARPAFAEAASRRQVKRSSAQPRDNPNILLQIRFSCFVRGQQAMDN